MYGSKPTDDDIKSKGDNCCPICQDDYQDPIMLACKVRWMVHLNHCSPFLKEKSLKNISHQMRILNLRETIAVLSVKTIIKIL